MAKTGKTQPPVPTDRYKPPGATPLEVAQASPYATSIRLAGEPILHPDEMVGDRYKVDMLLGRGGFGDVYRAVHQGTRERVALKVLRPELLADSTSVERFTHEARMSAGLRHPNTVRVFDFGRISGDGPLYLAMEYLEGESLETILHKEGPLPPHRAAHLVGQVLKSLAEAHGKKLVHRDLKPENIFVGESAGETDFVHVIDFGIAKFVAEGQSPVLTQAGAILGTPHYMSPEQIRGNGIDARADLYSTGVVLYRCLTGRHPFDGDTTFGVLAAHLQDDLPKVKMPGVDADLETLVAKSLAREREDRFATADAFRHALEGWAAKHPVFVPVAAQIDDKTSMSDVITLERLKPVTEPHLPATAETVIGAIPQDPDAHRPVSAPPTVSIVQAPSAVISGITVAAPEEVDVDAVTEADPRQVELPQQLGSDTSVLAKPEALLASIAQHGPRPSQRPPSRQAPVPPNRPPSKSVVRPIGAVSGQMPPAARAISEEMRTVSMDVVHFPPPVAPGLDANKVTTPGAQVAAVAAIKPPPKPLPLWVLGLAVVAVATVAGFVAWRQIATSDVNPALPVMVAPPIGAANSKQQAANSQQPAAVPAAPATATVVAVAPAVVAAVAPTPVVTEVPKVEAPPADVPKVEVAHAKPKSEAKQTEPKAVMPKADVVPKVPKGSCGAPEGSKDWCMSCSAASELSPTSKFFCPCLVARGKTDGLAYYCKCVFPKETHKLGSPPFCRCNPRDPSCQQE